MFRSDVIQNLTEGMINKYYLQLNRAINDFLHANGISSVDLSKPETLEDQLEKLGYYLQITEEGGQGFATIGGGKGNRTVKRTTVKMQLMKIMATDVKKYELETKVV